MPDLLDEILEKLSPAALELLDKIDLNAERESRKFSDELQKSLNELEEIEMKRYIREMDNKAMYLVRKTGKQKHLLDKYKQQFEKIRSLEVHGDHMKKIKIYSEQIESLQQQLNKLLNNSNAEELFTEVIDIYEKTEELELRKKELTDALKCYESFPANLREAQYCISDLKEKILKKEAMLEG